MSLSVRMWQSRSKCIWEQDFNIHSEEKGEKRRERSGDKKYTKVTITWSPNFESQINLGCIYEISVTFSQMDFFFRSPWVTLTFDNLIQICSKQHKYRNACYGQLLKACEIQIKPFFALENSIKEWQWWHHKYNEHIHQPWAAADGTDKRFAQYYYN